jgi:hypothetical protein
MAGRKIHDHGGMPASSDALMKSKTHVKHFMSAGGIEKEGMLDYPDTTEHIHRDQEHGMKKANAHKMKDGYRY